MVDKIAVSAVFAVLWVITFGCGYRYGQDHTDQDPPLVCLSTAPYQEAVERCDKALLTCASWQARVVTELDAMQAQIKGGCK